jgi:SAM-dependent methyltransferase
MPDQWHAFDLVEAFQLARAVATLHDLGLLAALKQPATADELSSRYALDAGLLRGVLEYVAARTDLLRKSGGRFVTTRAYAGGSRFLLDLYVGAYGGNAARLAELLRDPTSAPKAVNRALHARAFDAADGSTLGVLPEIIRRLGFNHLLDLGCGSGALLLELAGQDSEFVGWGIDINPAMCRVARARIRAARLGKRVRVTVGDCRNPTSMLPAGVSDRVRAVTACNVANEMFGDGGESAVAWLQGLRQALPGRPLLLVDYYGRLGRKGGRPDPRTLLHDYVQLISGQGVPPANAAEWRSIYSRAGCRPLHIIEDKATTRFIHILRL